MDKKFKSLTQELPGDGTKTELSGKQTAPCGEGLHPNLAEMYARAHRKACLSSHAHAVCSLPVTEHPSLKEYMEQMLQNPAPTGELKRARAALERTIILVQEHAGEDERRKLISDLGTFGRLLERETARPDGTQAQTLARLACGILDGSVHLFPRPEEGGRIRVALLDTIRREEAAQLTFREMGGSYFIETVEVRSAPPHRKVPPDKPGYCHPLHHGCRDLCVARRHPRHEGMDRRP